MSTLSHPILSAFLGQRSVTKTKSSAQSSAQSSAVVKAAADKLLEAARVVVASYPSPVRKDAAAPQTGPRYVVRAPVTAPAAPGTAQAVMQAAVRAVPEPDSAWDPAAAFDEARARRDDGRYGTPVAEGPRS